MSSSLSTPAAETRTTPDLPYHPPSADAAPQPAAEAQAQGGGEAVAWMRRWAFDNVGVMAIPKKERPRGWHLLPVTPTKALDDDVPLYAAPPSAPVGVEGFDKWFDEYTKNNYTDEMLAEAAWKAALAQQPAAVNEAMVERALAAYLRRQEDGESLYGCVTAALTAALAAQPGGSDNG